MSDPTRCPRCERKINVITHIAELPFEKIKRLRFAIDVCKHCGWYQLVSVRKAGGENHGVTQS